MNNLKLANKLIGARLIRPINKLIADGATIIKKEADFPLPVAGNITLENKSYIIDGTVVMTNTLTAPASGAFSFSAIGLSLGTLFYTGSGTFLNGVLPNGVFSGMYNGLIVAATQNATLFNMSGAGGIFYTQDVVFANFGNMGTFTDASPIMNYTSIAQMGSGLTCDACSIVAFTSPTFSNWQNNTTSFITTQNNPGFLIVSAGNLQPGSNETIFNITDAVTLGNIYANTTLFPDRFWASGSRDDSSKEMTVSINPGVKDSTVSAQLEFTSNALVTNVPVQDAYIVINATTWSCSLTERISCASDGTTTYDGLEDVNVALDGNIDLEPAVGNAVLLRAQFINVHAHTTFTVTFTNGTNTINETATALSNGDTISFWNTAGTLPAELREDILYFVVNKATDSFQVSYTSGGAAVAFTDDGTPTNSYSNADLVGSPGRSSVDINDPVDVIPQALAEMETDDQILVVVQNQTNAQNIEVVNGYFRLIKV